MYCKYCGAPNADDGKFCQSCGQRLTEEEPAYAEPAYSQPSYSQPDYSQPSYSQPDYSQPDYSQPVPLVQSRSVAPMVMGLIASGLMFISFLIYFSSDAVEIISNFLDLSSLSAMIVLETAAVLMLGIGFILKGAASRVLAGLAPFVLSFNALMLLIGAIELADSRYSLISSIATFLILCSLLQLMFLLSGIGILTRKKGMIVGGTIPAFIGSAIFNICLIAAFSELSDSESSEVMPFLVFRLFAIIFVCISLFCYRPQSK